MEELIKRKDEDVSEANNLTEIKLKHLLDCSPSVIFSYSANQKNAKITFISENVKDVVGYEPKEFYDPKFWQNCVHPDDLKFFKSEFSSLIEVGHFAIEYRFKQKDGSYRWFRDERNVFYDNSGQPLEIIGALFDINDQKIEGDKVLESEKRLKLLFESASEFIHILDKDAKILESNFAAIQSLGYTKEELFGRSITEFLTTDSKKIFSERFPILKKKGASRLELDIVCKNGKVRTVDSATSAVCIENDNNSFFVTFQRDVTDHKLAEDAMHRSEEKYRVLIEASPNTIFKEDLNGNFLFVNCGFSDILGYTRDESMHLNILSIVHRNDLEKLKERALLLSKGERVYNVEYRLKHKYGSYISFVSDSSPVLDSKGKVVAFLSIAKKYQAKTSR